MEITELTNKEKEVLRKLVKNTCEQCHKHEKEVGTLEVHRMKRGNKGGEYILRNIRIVCKGCHKEYHYNEEGINRF